MRRNICVGLSCSIDSDCLAARYRELKVMQDCDRKAVGIEKELPVVIPFDDISDLTGEGITSIEDYLGIEKYPDDI